MARPLKHSERRAVDRLLVGVHYRDHCRAGTRYGKKANLFLSLGWLAPAGE